MTQAILGTVQEEKVMASKLSLATVVQTLTGRPKEVTAKPVMDTTQKRKQRRKKKSNENP